MPTEPLCPDVPGPSVSGHQQDLRSAGCRFDPALYVWWGPALWLEGVFLPPDAAHARGPWPAGAGDACQIRTSLVWDSLEDCHRRVSFPLLIGLYCHPEGTRAHLFNVILIQQSSYDSDGTSRDEIKERFSLTMDFVENYLREVVSQNIPFSDKEKNKLTFEVSSCFWTVWTGETTPVLSVLNCGVLS